MRQMLVTSIAAALLCAGCSEPEKRLNAPPHGRSAATSDLQGTFVYMHDNALLADMTVSDVHFLPHRPVLSTVGEERVSRLAQLLDAYGGTIRFNSDETDKELRGARLETVRRHLADAGLDTTAEIVRDDLPGGRGMDAGEAVLIKLNEGTYKPKRSAGGGGSGTSASNAPRP